MMACWWPCCGDSYNIRRFNSSGTLLWSNTLADAQSISHVDVYGTDMFLAAGRDLYKYDISGAPSQTWKFEGSNSHLGANSLGFAAIKPTTDGGVVCISQNNYSGLSPEKPPPHITEYGNTGYYIFKVTSAGALAWRRRVSVPNVYSHLAYWESGEQNSRGKSIAVDTSGNIYVGMQYVYTTYNWPNATWPSSSPWLYGRPVNILKLNSSGTFLDAYSGLTPTEATYSTSGMQLAWGPIFSVDTDSTRIYWCTIGKFHPSNITVIGAVNCADGSFPWSSPTQNKSKTFGYHIVRQFASGLLCAGRIFQAVPSGYTAAPFRVWTATTGIYSHEMTGIDYSWALDVTPDGSPVTSYAANVDLDTGTLPAGAPVNEEWGVGTPTPSPIRTLAFGGSGSIKRANSAYTFPAATNGHILAGDVINV